MDARLGKRYRYRRIGRGKIMKDRIISGVVAILMIAAIAYGGSWLYQFLLELFKKTV
jgi:hypothetical protein